MIVLVLWVFLEFFQGKYFVISNLSFVSPITPEEEVRSTFDTVVSYFLFVLEMPQALFNRMA